jgi:hypothetical protein
LIQFHFKGSAKFIFNQGNYALVKEEKSLLLYNPQKLPLNLELAILGDFGHCINKEISCFIFNRSELYHFFW